MEGLSVQGHLLPIVVFAVMITVGIELKLEQFKLLLMTPRVPILGTLIHTLCFPLITLGLVVGISQAGIVVSEATILGMLLIAACPSGGFSNVLAMIGKANLPLSVLLTAISSILSFLSVPLLIGAFSFVVAQLDQPIVVPIGATLGQLLVLVVIPVFLGMVWRHLQEARVAALADSLQKGAQIVLYVTIALLIAESWDVMVIGIDEALGWSLLLCVLNVGVCLGIARLARFEAKDAVTIALEGAIRNLAVAFLVAANVLDRLDVAVLPTVYFLAMLIVGVLFAKTWHKWLTNP